MQYLMQAYHSLALHLFLYIGSDVITRVVPFCWCHNRKSRCHLAVFATFPLEPRKTSAEKGVPPVHTRAIVPAGAAAAFVDVHFAESAGHPRWTLALASLAASTVAAGDHETHTDVTVGTEEIGRTDTPPQIAVTYATILTAQKVRAFVDAALCPQVAWQTLALSVPDTGPTVLAVWGIRVVWTAHVMRTILSCHIKVHV